MQPCLRSSYFSYSFIRILCLCTHWTYNIVKVLMLHICIFIAWSFCVCDIPSSVQDGQGQTRICWWSWVGSLLSKEFIYPALVLGRIRRCSLGDLLVSCYLSVFCHLTYYSRCVYYWHKFPVNCEIVIVTMGSHFIFVCVLNFLNFKIPFSVTERILNNILFMLYSELYFTYLWNPFDSYYHPVKQTEDFVTERRAREKGRRWCFSKAAILQRSFTISKAKMCKSHNKDRLSPFFVSPLFTFPTGTYSVAKLRVPFSCCFSIYSICLYFSLELLED